MLDREHQIKTRQERKHTTEGRREGENGSRTGRLCSTLKLSSSRRPRADPYLCAALTSSLGSFVRPLAPKQWSFLNPFGGRFTLIFYSRTFPFWERAQSCLIGGEARGGRATPRVVPLDRIGRVQRCQKRMGSTEAIGRRVRRSRLASCRAARCVSL